MSIAGRLMSKSLQGFACFWMALAALVPAPAGAQSLTPGEFADSFLRAAISTDEAQRLALLHPRTRACIDMRTRPYFDWIFTRRARLAAKVSGRFKTALEPLSSQAGMATDGKSDYPVRPSHLLTIDYSTSTSNSLAIVVAVLREGGVWYEVLPCPRPEAIEGARASDAHRGGQEQGVNTLLASLREPLRGEIVALARSGRRIDAIKKLQQGTGTDLATAKDAVDILVPR